MDIDRFHFPDDLMYYKEHNWARIAATRLRSA